MPKVSVIVPNYNHARFLRQRLDSILAQTFQDFELILLDDCSTDDSQSILREYASDPRVRLEFNEVNSGSTFKQWNKGVRMASGKYVWIAESDDYADVRLLERLVAVLQADPEVIFVYCRSWRVDDKGQRDGFGDYYLVDFGLERWAADYVAGGEEECRNYFVYRNIVANASAVLFRREAYQRVGGADEGFRMCGDWKVWASMALLGRVAYLSEPLSFFRVHDQSIWGTWGRRGLAAQETLQVIRWMLSKVRPRDFASNVNLHTLASGIWIPVLISRGVPLRRKRAIIWDAMAVDRRALGRLAEAVRLKLLGKIIWSIRNYAWHPILNATRAVRRPLGLNQSKFRALLKRGRQ